MTTEKSPAEQEPFDLDREVARFMEEIDRSHFASVRVSQAISIEFYECLASECSDRAGTIRAEIAQKMRESGG